MTARYSLDSIVIRDRRLFGWGFCLLPSGPLQSCRIRVPLVDGRSALVDVLPGGYREDLAAAFPALGHAGGSGFLVNALLPVAPADGEASLVVRSTDGEESVLPLPSFPHAYLAATEVALSQGWVRVREVARQRGWPAALRSVLRAVSRKMAAFSGIRRADPGRRARTAVVFDHGMGGGANRYRETRVEALLRGGLDVVVVHPELSTLSYVLDRRTVAGVRSAERVTDQTRTLAVIDGLAPVHVEINNLVGFEDPLAVLDWAGEWRSSDMARFLRFQLHDFHAVCPAFTLVGTSQSHCGVPALSDCLACLPDNARNTLGLHNDVDLPRWRSAWERLLLRADQCVAFSGSSVALLRRALPEATSVAFDIQPHQTDLTGIRPVAPRLDDPVTIAAVGHLSHAKGASLVRDLARRAAERGLPLRFVVVGTLEEGAKDVVGLGITGGFDRARLAAMLEDVRAGIAFVPSICPETYSYVTDELMATELPLMVLDLGAPAERVANYARGCLLPRSGTDAQLDAIAAFANRLKTSAPVR